MATAPQHHNEATIPGVLLLTAAAVALLAVRVWRLCTRPALPTEFKGTKCEPPPVHGRWWDPLGLYGRVEQMREAARRRSPWYWSELYDQLGDTYQYTVAGARTITTRDPKNIKAVLGSQFEDFALNGRPHFLPLLGKHGIFVQDGAAWSLSRTLLRPAFERAHVASLGRIEPFIRGIIARITPGKPVDIQELFQDLMMDASTDFLLGTPISTVLASVAQDDAAKDAKSQSFSEAYDHVQDIVGLRMVMAQLSWLMNPASFRRACSIVHTNIHRYVSAAIEQRAAGAGKATGGGGEGKEDTHFYSFLEALVARVQDPQIIHDQIMSILFAGRDTTASLLAWTFHCLAKHPEVAAKLRAEIAATVGDGAPTEQDVKGMKYMSWVQQEVLRLYPPVPINAKTAVRATTLPTGGGPDGSSPIAVPAGTRIVWTLFSVQRRTDLWGPDANQFRPERWGEPAARQARIDWAWLPFNGGPRVCVGQQLALVHSAYYIIRLLQNFKKLEPVLATVKEEGEGEGQIQQKVGEVEEMEKYAVRLGAMSKADGVHVLLS